MFNIRLQGNLLAGKIEDICRLKLKSLENVFFFPKSIGSWTPTSPAMMKTIASKTMTRQD